MKKIMVAATVFCVAAFAEAATIAWSGVNFLDHSGKQYNGNVDLMSYLTSGSVADAFKVASITTVSGAIPSTDKANVFTVDSLVAGNNYNFYMVVQDGDYTFTSAEKTNIPMQPTGTAGVGFGNMAKAMGDAKNWTGSVPEPTSGLLLLLGMAGLALRRRHA